MREYCDRDSADEDYRDIIEATLGVLLNKKGIHKEQTLKDTVAFLTEHFISNDIILDPSFIPPNAPFSSSSSSSSKNSVCPNFAQVFEIAMAVKADHLRKEQHTHTDAEKPQNQTKKKSEMDKKAQIRANYMLWVDAQQPANDDGDEVQVN